MGFATLVDHLHIDEVRRGAETAVGEPVGPEETTLKERLMYGQEPRTEDAFESEGRGLDYEAVDNPQPEPE